MSTHIKDAWEVQANKDIAASQARISDLIEHNEMLDDDGYPTDAALDVIRLWHWNDIPGWFKFIEGIWSNYGRWTEKDMPSSWASSEMDHVYDVATGGWSGNESIIRAMQDNRMMWLLNWYQSTRGGHYIFVLKEISE